MGQDGAKHVLLLGQLSAYLILGKDSRAVGGNTPLTLFALSWLETQLTAAQDAAVAATQTARSAEAKCGASASELAQVRACRQHPASGVLVPCTLTVLMKLGCIGKSTSWTMRYLGHIP